MKTVVPVVIEMDDNQLLAYAERLNLPSPLRMRDVVATVREEVLAIVASSESFGIDPVADFQPRAAVTLKGAPS